jgi:uncharacterized membrane protein
MSTDGKKAGKLSIFCGIWNLIMGFLFGFSFIFVSFEGKHPGVGKLYDQIGSNISDLGMCFFIFGLISCILLIVGGIKLFSSSEKTSVTNVGLLGVYVYYLCFIVMDLLLATSGGKIENIFFFIGVCVFIMVPTFFLQRILTKLL